MTKAENNTENNTEKTDQAETPDLEKIRTDLEEKRTELMTQLGEEEDELRSAPGENPDRSSLAQRYADRQLNLAFHDQALEHLEQVERALQKLDEEKYGKCENCGETIAAARLEALPHAPLCVACQSEQDRRP
jgi:RNA polymerase-binding protein DksA